MRGTSTARLNTFGGFPPRNLDALLTWVVTRDWALALIGDDLTEKLIVRLLASDDERSLLAALSQIDRLDDWHSILSALLENSARERVALAALATLPRLDGPYASCALGDALRRRIGAALAARNPAEALWAVALDIGRWLRHEPSLDRLSLAVPDPTLRLSAVASRLRDLAREVEWGGLTPEISARASSLPSVL